MSDSSFPNPPNQSPCVLPWTTLKIEFTGAANICCANHTVLGDVRTQSLAEIWNAEPIRTIRADLSQGRLATSSCRNCPYVGSWDGIKALPDPLADPRSPLSGTRAAWQRGSAVVDSTPFELFLYFPFPCNLDCVMCMQVPERADRRNMLPMDERILEKVREWCLGNYGRLSMLGGEVFIQKRAVELIDFLIDRRLSEIHLGVTTNGTVLDRHWERLERIEKLSLGFSTDAVSADVYEKIRLKGDWSQVDANIRRFREKTRTRPNWGMVMSAVVQRRNLGRLAEMVRYCLELDVVCYFSPMVGSHAVSENPFLDPSLLGEAPGWEEDLLEAIEACEGAGTPSSSQTAATLRPVLSQLRRVARNPGLVVLPATTPAPRRAREEFFAQLKRRLAAAPGRRIACYGGGADFREAVADGLLTDHQVVALLDDGLPPGTDVAGHRVRAFEDLASLKAELLIATSSAYGPTLRERAAFRLEAMGLKLPIV